MKGYSTFHKTPALPESHHQIVYCHIQDTQWGLLPLCRDAVDVFYSPSQLGYYSFECVFLIQIIWAQLYGIKYSYLIQIICQQYGFK